MYAYVGFYIISRKAVTVYTYEVLLKDPCMASIIAVDFRSWYKWNRRKLFSFLFSMYFIGPLANIPAPTQYIPLLPTGDHRTTHSRQPRDPPAPCPVNQLAAAALDRSPAASVRPFPRTRAAACPQPVLSSPVRSPCCPARTAARPVLACPQPVLPCPDRGWRPDSAVRRLSRGRL